MVQQILNPDIEAYIQNLVLQQDDSDVLRQMELLAEKESFPIVGPQVGQALYLLAKSINAKKVFELGSGYCYSAYWFAKAVGKGGKVTCTDSLKLNSSRAEGYLKNHEFWPRIDYHLGIAQDLFQKTNEEFDIIYNDVDKEQYPSVFQLVWKQVRSGGFYISDNALWCGRVIEEQPEDKVLQTHAVKEHNEMVFSHPEFETMLLPIRDGVIVARRK